MQQKNSWQDAEKVRQRKKIVVWFVWSIWFVWLKDTNQMNQINQMTRRSFPDSSGRFTNDKSGLLSILPAVLPMCPMANCWNSHMPTWLCHNLLAPDHR
jgi:hypothetical protein